MLGFRREIDLKSDLGKDQATSVVEALAEEMFAILDVDKGGCLDWCEFKLIATIDR